MTSYIQNHDCKQTSVRSARADLRGCPDCGLLCTLPKAEAGTDVFCGQCGKSFSRPRSRSLDHALSYAALGLVFCLLAITAPFLDVSLYGRYQTSTMWTGAAIMEGQGFPWLGYLVLAATILMPLAKLSLTVFVLGGLRYDQPPRAIVPAFRWIKHIAPWSMLEVFLLGFLVAYTRLQNLATVHIDLAVYAMIGTVVAMAAMDQALDRESVWKAIQAKGLTEKTDRKADAPLLSCRVCHQASQQEEGGDCPRCGATLHHRKHDSFNRTWAFIAAALIFYIPANVFPVMNITKLGQTSSHTIAGGMMEFWEEGMWPLALLIFLASIAIPVFKLVALAYMLLSARYGSGRNLVGRTRLYRAVDFIGRWSMVDIFMVSILVSLMQFGAFATIVPDVAAPSFAMVVIMTMLAVESFDPRLMWDRADPSDRDVYERPPESIIP